MVYSDTLYPSNSSCQTSLVPGGPSAGSAVSVRGSGSTATSTSGVSNTTIVSASAAGDTLSQCNNLTKSLLKQQILLTRKTLNRRRKSHNIACRLSAPHDVKSSKGLENRGRRNVKIGRTREIVATSWNTSSSSRTFAGVKTGQFEHHFLGHLRYGLLQVDLARCLAHPEITV